MRDLWKLKLGWDDVITDDLYARWEKLYQDFMLLGNLEFPRQVFRDSDSADLYIFCDASKAAYGFVVYIVQGSKPVLFSKAKVAPIVTKSLPTLELLSVYRVLTCLKNTYKVFCHLSIKNLFVAMDAQIVLAWLLSFKVNRKNICCQSSEGYRFA